MCGEGFIFSKILIYMFYALHMIKHRKEGAIWYFYPFSMLNLVIKWEKEIANTLMFEWCCTLVSHTCLGIIDPWVFKWVVPLLANGPAEQIKKSARKKSFFRYRPFFFPFQSILSISGCFGLFWLKQAKFKPRFLWLYFILEMKHFSQNVKKMITVLQSSSE